MTINECENEDQIECIKKASWVVTPRGTNEDVEFELHAGEGVLGRILLGDHFLRRGLALHGASDRQLGSFVVVLEDLLVVLGGPVNEHAAHDNQTLGLIFGNDTSFHTVSHSLGDGELSRAKHLDGLPLPFDGDLRDHDSRRLDGQVRLKHGQQVAVSH